MIDKIKRVDIQGSASYYEEIPVFIKIFPIINKVEVSVERRFYNSNDELIRVESGDDLSFNHTFSEQDLNKIIKVIKDKK